MNWGITEIDGWFYTPKWRYYQRCEGNVVAYIEKMVGFYRLHVTWKGQLGMCDIEYWNEDFDLALNKAVKLLDKYKDSEKEDLWNNFFSPHNLNGFWIRLCPQLQGVHMKPRYVNNK